MSSASLQSLKFTLFSEIPFTWLELLITLAITSAGSRNKRALRGQPCLIPSESLETLIAIVSNRAFSITVDSGDPFLKSVS